VKNLFNALTNTILQKSESNGGLEIGQSAPEFSLIDQHQQPCKLTDYHGKWVVLYFYPKVETPICTKEACSFRDHNEALISKQAVILGVSVDSVANHQAFANHHQLPFRLLADTKGLVAKQYNALLDLKVKRFAKRHSFIIDPQGRIAKIYRNVNANQHVTEILEDLSELQHEN